MKQENIELLKRVRELQNEKVDLTAAYREQREEFEAMQKQVADEAEK